VLVVVGIGAAMWVSEQNRIYQANLAKLAAASQPIGHLAGTVDTYIPKIVDIADYWVHKE
jgi:hypothetical protein